VAFDGRDVHESRDLPKIVAATPVGKDVTVAVVRDGKPQSLTVKLGRLEDAVQQAALEKGKGADLPRPAVQQALGMSLAQLSDELRKQYDIKDTVRGVVVTAVDPASPAADKVKPGDVVVEVNQVAVTDPADIALKIKAVKDLGKKTALLLVSNGQGEVRYVAVAVN